MGTQHKWAEVLRAIADGKTVEWQGSQCTGCWHEGTDTYNPIDDWHLEWRIKPEPKPDSVQYMNVYKTGKGFGCTTSNVKTLAQCEKASGDFLRGRIKLVIDGETGKLKSAEAL